MEMLARFNEKLGKVVDVLCGIVMAALFLMVSFQVSNRFIFKVPAAWTEEFARYIFVWSSLLGTVKGLRAKRLLGVDMLVMGLRGKKRAVVDLAATLITMVFFIVLGVTGWTYAVRGIPVLNDTGMVSMFFVYVSIPFCCVLCLPILLQHLLEAVKGVLQTW